MDLFVIYTGKKRGIPAEISLQEEFQIGRKLDLKATVLRLTDTNNVVDQYINLCLVFDKHLHGVKGEEQRAIALNNAIDECIEKGYLSEYLQARREEVLAMLAQYFYQADFVEAANAGKWERKMQAKLDQGRAEGRVEGRVEGMAVAEDNYILRLLKRNKPAENIVDTVGCEYNQVVKVAKQHNLPLL